ncbi:MAG: hypothetical protein PVF97_00500 [Desulfobacterales bacterium]|jgi:hypothetical protein
MAPYRLTLKKINLPIRNGFLRYFIIFAYIFALYLFPQNTVPNEFHWYALLIGGGATNQDCLDSFYSNITYANSTLLKLGYNQKNIKLLFFNGKSTKYPLAESAATKINVVKELSRISKIADVNDSLLIFRSGHGIIELIFHKYGILPKGKVLKDDNFVHTIGTAAVMCFPDGYLSYLELQEILKRIEARQIVLILNQCYSGQFTQISNHLANTVVISQTEDVGYAFHSQRTPENWETEVWPFVKCIFDGFLPVEGKSKRKSVSEAFEYMLSCNPNVQGVPILADRPLIIEKPQIRYGKKLKRGTVFINKVIRYHR